MVCQWEQSKASPEEVFETYWGSLAEGPGEEKPSIDRFANQLFRQVACRATEIDDLIRKHAANWRMERMAVVDRNLLRLAICEMLEGDTAPAVVIDEAIEIGRRYSGEESARFLNGILDAVRQSLSLPKDRPAPVSEE
jgi:N utilization substance protein B